MNDARTSKRGVYFDPILKLLDAGYPQDDVRALLYDVMPREEIEHLIKLAQRELSGESLRGKFFAK